MIPLYYSWQCSKRSIVVGINLSRKLLIRTDLEWVLINIVQELHEVKGKLHHEQGEVLVSSSTLKKNQA